MSDNMLNSLYSFNTRHRNKEATDEVIEGIEKELERLRKQSKSLELSRGLKSYSLKHDTDFCSDEMREFTCSNKFTDMINKDVEQLREEQNNELNKLEHECSKFITSGENTLLTHKQEKHDDIASAELSRIKVKHSYQ